MVAELCRILLLLNRFRGKSLVSKKLLLPWKKRWSQVIKLLYLPKKCYSQRKDLCTYLQAHELFQVQQPEIAQKMRMGLDQSYGKTYYREPRKHYHRKSSETLPDASCSEVLLAERNEWNPDCSTVNDKGHKESNYLTQAHLVTGQSC